MASSLDALARSFTRHLRAEGKADRTTVIYVQSVTYFGRWLADQGQPQTLGELTRSHLLGWFGSLTERGLEPGTIRTRHKGMTRFCRWLVDEGEIAEDPMRGLEAPTPREKPVPIVADEDLAKLLRACSGRDIEDRRDEAMFRVLLDCGVRVSELCGLTVSGIDLDHETALVTGKGNKIRPIYFGARTARSLDRYLRLRSAHRWAHLDALWLSQRGAMSPDGVRERLNARADQAGLGHLHPHQMRHTFAHDFLVSGGQERDLKRLAGWSSDVMLERYGASAAQARAEAAARRMRRGDRI